jgi:hypothetical protein
MTSVKIKIATAAAILLFISGCNKTTPADPKPEITPTSSGSSSGDQPQGNDWRVTPNLQEPGMGQTPAEDQKTTTPPAPDAQTQTPPPPPAAQ